MARLTLIRTGQVLLVALSVGFFGACSGRHAAPTKHVTVAEVQTVHSSLTANGQAVLGMRRLADPSVLETDKDGRARVRLDDGTTVVLDRSTRLELTSQGAKLLSGQLFVQAAPSAHTQLQVGSATALVSGATVALQKTDAQATLFCASGEFTVRDAKSAETRVRSGETATVRGDQLTIAPEAAFEDWTSGMASPWASAGTPRRALGELWGRTGKEFDGDPGSPLTIRASQVSARIDGEMAQTEVRTTYFNAGSASVFGDFRMAVPPDATVSGFSIVRGERTTPASIKIAEQMDITSQPGDGRLEWAGDGWLRGSTFTIVPGETLTLVVSYVEWLNPSSGRMLYRYPLVSSAQAPRIGEFFAQIDWTGAQAQNLWATSDAVVSGSRVTLHRSDYVPNADLVVEAEVPADEGSARSYFSRGSQNDPSGSYLLVRTEVPQAPAEQGAAVALVLDTSESMEPALLDTSRALVEALVQGLGEKDRVVVFAADQSVRPVGPSTLGALNSERRTQILQGLGQIQPGGATDLGRALEQAANALPADAPAGMVIYVGDGWPTLGDGRLQQVEERLAKRERGMPRLAAVAVGPLANGFGLSALVRGSGPLLQVSDRTDAASAAIDLMAEALRPAVADVQLVFPPGVERVYPRNAQALIAGSTVQAVARVPDTQPTQVTLRWRDQKGLHEQVRRLAQQSVPLDVEVRRRWALARVQELGFQAAGQQAAADIAYQQELLTPWTAWVMGTSNQGYAPTPLTSRMLDLTPSADCPFTSLFATPVTQFGTLTDPLNEPETDPAADDDAYRASIRAAGQRLIEEAGKQIRACRDARVALRPDLKGTLLIKVTIDSSGTVTKTTVSASDPSDSDPLLNQCVEVVMRGLQFPESTLTGDILIDTSFVLPPARQMVGRKCSSTSQLPLELRRGLWLERMTKSMDLAHTYLDALKTCELRTWADKRVMLDLMLNVQKNSRLVLEEARTLAQAGEEDAAAFLRRETLRRAQEPRELWALRRELIGEELLPLGVFRKQYRAAQNDEARLAVVRKFLPLAPHHMGLRRRLLTLLEALGHKEPLLNEITRARQDPLADATLLADAASALRRLGQEPEAKRAYSELSERAPIDPSVRAFLGDRLRAEGWYEDAIAAYSSLETLAPEDPATTMRLAMAYAGAGRLDLATRLWTRLGQSGGRALDNRMGELGMRLAAAHLLQKLHASDTRAEEKAMLERRLSELPWTEPGTWVIVQTPRLFYPVQVILNRGPKQVQERRRPDIDAPSLGLSSFQLSVRDDKDLELEMRRPAALSPESSVPLQVMVVRADVDLSHATLVTQTIPIAASGEPLRMRLDGASLSLVQ